jgi:alpha-beta hydrolase superfamily lysophospholipase
VEAFAFQGSDGFDVAAWRLRPSGPARAVIQVAHGMSEHFGRYRRLSDRLTAEGYAVFGADHRGHGRSAEPYGFGEFGPAGFSTLVSDMAKLSMIARGEFPGLPFAMIGHSMGSFASQLYLLEHFRNLDALVLSGTAALDKLLERLLASGGPISLELLNAGFAPARTSFDWLSRDEAEVDAYIADPLCGFSVSDASMATMFGLGSQARLDPRLANVPHELPILIISGEVDPVVGLDQAFTKALIASWNEAGLTGITHRVYAGGRHEMFNETVRETVSADLIIWLERALWPDGSKRALNDTGASS